MYCSKCGVEVQSDARFCHCCGHAVTGTASHADDTPSERRLAKGPKALIVNVVASAAALWAALIAIGYFAGTGTQSFAAALGSAALSGAYALILFKRDARALGMSWIMV